MAEIGKDIIKSAALLTSGELVAIPTETVYGLAGNALDEKAVLQIFKSKNRPSFDPLIVHLAGIDQVYDYVEFIPDELKALADAFWPGALTLLLPKKDIIPDLVTSGLGRVGVRVPNHPLTRSLLELLDFPLAAPSANPFGYISPTSASHVQHHLGKELAYILDGGLCEVGLESTIVGMEQGQVIIYRLGGVSVGAIEEVVGKVLILPQSSSNPQSPGMLKSHYAPRKPMVLGDLDELMQQYQHEKEGVAILSFRRSFPDIPASNQVALSSSGDYDEAARNLFSAMRELDETNATLILAEELPEIHLGKAINDRLRRAAAK
ncbi:L-threonylcarbamoyladenylate synthase [Cyclobacterium qasimii]|uniref:Threonylcarbamoyl-AMP synthase n=2 Tax=Cyclobacterium qasimii TaxID=1350429 RepID=S7VBS1_9BACT|nr:L-threonylcarbamoyladenylate synthase [Cyclobacterium qasimii]EPR67421.1 YrdC/Sua5 family protein, required for threonylcarbamoyladenosine (t(6)A) formation in tRNA [Cyclobacterium qasimii M12-11B]GEO21816.1 threonylcarbamoyl-AMP synthase [Cyclobacterium qasimii]